MFGPKILRILILESVLWSFLKFCRMIRLERLNFWNLEVHAAQNRFRGIVHLVISYLLPITLQSTQVWSVIYHVVSQFQCFYAKQF